MDRASVSSTSLRSVGYDAGRKMLEIEFQNGRVYQYFRVPGKVFRSLTEAPSLGSFFNAAIRNAYPFARLS
jgi:hypothetical protein